MFLSRLEKGKGHINTLNSFKIKEKKYKINVVGDGPEFKKIKKITELNLEKKVKMFGFLSKEKLEKIWTKTDPLLIMPSRVEGFGWFLLKR